MFFFSCNGKTGKTKRKILTPFMIMMKITARVEGCNSDMK